MSEADEDGEDEGYPEALRPGARFFDCGLTVRRDMMEMACRAPDSPDCVQLAGARNRASAPVLTYVLRQGRHLPR